MGSNEERMSTSMQKQQIMSYLVVYTLNTVSSSSSKGFSISILILNSWKSGSSWIYFTIYDPLIVVGL